MADNYDALDGVGDEPTLDGVEQQPAEDAQQQPDEMADIKKMMEGYNISTPDDLEALVEDLQQYKRGYGESRNEIGELRREIESLRGELSQKSEQRFQDPDDFGERPVNLQDEVYRAVQKFWTDQTRVQQEGQRKFMEERQALEQRPNWNQVQPLFDKALQRAEVQQAIASGKMSMDGLYSRINERVLMGAVNKLVQTLPQGQQVQQPATGHSTADRVAQPTPVDQQRAQAIERAKSERNVQGVLKNILPEDDPLLRF